MADKEHPEPEQDSNTLEAQKVDSLVESLKNVSDMYEKLTAQENELHQKSVQNLLIKAITQFSSADDTEIILKFGADPNGRSERGMRPMHYAAYANNLEAIKLLLEHGSEVNPKDDNGFTPVHLCADKGHTASLLYLIENGASVQEGVNYEEPESSDLSGEKTENEGGQVDHTDEIHSSTVEAATAEGPVGEGAEGNSSEDNPNRVPEEIIKDLTVEPLNLALENNHLEIVKILLKNGADPNRRYFRGYEINSVPLNYVECLEALLDYGANPNLTDRRGWTPLMTAAKENETRAVRLLLSRGANVDQQCHERFEQKTALHIALEAGNRNVVRSLCLHHATVSKLPNYKYNALHTAVLTDRVDLVELILLFPIDIDEYSEDNCSALMIACASTELQNQKQIIHKLLQYGADPNYHSDIVNYSAPYLSPLVEYLDNHPLPEYEIILKLIQYGATVHFSRRTAIVRQKDPFGVLAYVPIVMEHPGIWNLLVNACCYFDVNALSICMHFNKEQKEQYTSFGLKPLPLKQLVRLSIRRTLRPPIIEKILKLPLPVFLLKYLVFLVA